MQEIKNVQDLKKELNKEENRRKQVYMAFLCLEFVKKNPQYFMEIGMGWLNNDQFLFNSTIFGEFADRKLNTINHYFKSYDFEMKKMNASIKNAACDLYSVSSFVDQKCWCIRWCDGFTQSTTLEEAKNWRTVKSMKKNKLKNDKLKKKINNNDFTKSQFNLPLGTQLNILNRGTFYENENVNAPIMGTISNDINVGKPSLISDEIGRNANAKKEECILSNGSVSLDNTNSFKDSNSTDDYYNSFDLNVLLDDNNLGMLDHYCFSEFDYQQYDDYEQYDDYFLMNDDFYESNDQWLF